MKAVILSAGQGKRLMPLTANNPKCLLNIEGQSIIEWQINELHKCGIDQISVVAGYQADRVRQLLHNRYRAQQVQVLFNPTYAWTDNLFSCWVARTEMGEDFLLLNGDTLFEAAVLRRLVQTPVRAITVATHKKQYYDADDMKVALDGQRLIRIGKDLPPDEVDGESVGMILFRQEGPAMFRRAVESALCDPAASRKWYLSVINQMAQSLPIWTCPSDGLQWCEVDFPADLKLARNVVQACDPADSFNTYPLSRYAWG